MEFLLGFITFMSIPVFSIIIGYTIEWVYWLIRRYYQGHRGSFGSSARPLVIFLWFFTLPVLGVVFIVKKIWTIIPRFTISSINLNVYRLNDAFDTDLMYPADLANFLKIKFPHILDMKTMDVIRELVNYLEMTGWNKCDNGAYTKILSTKKALTWHNFRKEITGE